VTRWLESNCSNAEALPDVLRCLAVDVANCYRVMLTAQRIDIHVRRTNAAVGVVGLSSVCVYVASTSTVCICTCGAGHVSKGA
jgi:hypothetical protein